MAAQVREGATMLFSGECYQPCGLCVSKEPTEARKETGMVFCSSGMVIAAEHCTFVSEGAV